MESYFSGIWAYVYARTRNHHAADDLTQEVFIRALTNLDKFRHQSSHKTWLYSIARNLCKDYAKSAFIRRVVPLSEWRFHSSQSTQSDVEDLVLHEILSDELWNHIFRLGIAHREVILLHLKEDLTFRQISEITGEKEVTVRARYRRAVERLRKLMHGGGDHDV